MTHPGTSAASSLNQSYTTHAPLGMGGAGNGGLFGQTLMDTDLITFSFEPVENGFIVHFNRKRYICNSIDEAFERAKVCLVEARLDKK